MERVLWKVEVWVSVWKVRDGLFQSAFLLKVKLCPSSQGMNEPIRRTFHCHDLRRAEGQIYLDSDGTQFPSTPFSQTLIHVNHYKLEIRENVGKNVVIHSCHIYQRKFLTRAQWVTYWCKHMEHSTHCRYDWEPCLESLKKWPTAVL